MYAIKMRRAAAKERICCVSGTCIRLHYSRPRSITLQCCNGAPHRPLLADVGCTLLHHDHMRSTHAQAGQHAFDGELQRSINGKAAGTLMPAAAKRFGNGSNVDRALAAQAYTEAPINQLAEKRR